MASGATDLVGLARALAVDPELPSRWLVSDPVDPAFPRFDSTPSGGVTAWYTMRLTDIARHAEHKVERTLEGALAEYDARDERRVAAWTTAFGSVADR